MPAPRPRHCPRCRKDTDVLSIHCLRIAPCVVERQLCVLQQQPLLRVHRRGLRRRDPEEPRVEELEVIHEAAPLQPLPCVLVHALLSHH